MKKYVLSTTEDLGFKGRYDLVDILEKEGYKKLFIKSSEKPNIWILIKELFTNKKKLKEYLKSMNNCELVFIYPWNSMSLGYSKMIKKYAKKNKIKTIVILVDINQERVTSLLGPYFFKYFVNEYKFYNNFDYIICHNDKMKKTIMSHGIKEEKIISQGAFDYLLDFKNKIVFDDFKKISVAGNLTKEKAGYIHELPKLKIKNFKMELYGRFDGKETKNIKYMGNFDPTELVKKLNGGFGLVWDGNSIDTCDGKYGEYLRINNPNKFSLYLGCGIPIIIWKEQALSDVVVKNKIGFAISSLSELDDIFKNLTKEEYKEMVNNIQKLNDKVRNGKFLLEAIEATKNN